MHEYTRAKLRYVFSRNWTCDWRMARWLHHHSAACQRLRSISSSTSGLTAWIPSAHADSNPTICGLFWVFSEQEEERARTIFGLVTNPHILSWELLWLYWEHPSDFQGKLRTDQEKFCMMQAEPWNHRKKGRKHMNSTFHMWETSGYKRTHAQTQTPTDSDLHNNRCQANANYKPANQSCKHSHTYLQNNDVLNILVCISTTVTLKPLSLPQGQNERS